LGARGGGYLKDENRNYLRPKLSKRFKQLIILFGPAGHTEEVRNVDLLAKKHRAYINLWIFTLNAYFRFTRYLAKYYAAAEHVESFDEARNTHKISDRKPHGTG
jgi:hypothetical protein